MRGRSKNRAVRRRSMTAAIVGFLVVSAGFLSAHHTFTTTYQEEKQITIRGTLDRVVYRNPHSYVYLRVSDRDNQTRLWVVECGSPDQMRRQRLIVDSLKPGDLVVVTGSPGRDPGDHRLRLRTIARGDA